MNSGDSIASDLISSGGVLSYFCTDSSLDDPSLAARALRELNEEEMRRYERFAFERSKREFLIGKVLVRKVLGKLLKVDSRSIEFRLSSSGKPLLATSIDAGIEFNLSHTRSLIAAVFSKECAVGIDVEVIDPNTATGEVAERFFSDPENERLRKFSGEGYIREFYKIWTLKEAWLKARGSGISIPLKSFSFDIPSKSNCGISIRFLSELDENPDEWQFQLASPTAEHFLALAIHRRATPDRTVHLQEIGVAELLAPDGI